MSRLNPQPRTKIVATLGPATSTAEQIQALVERGMSVARINASHSDHESGARLIAAVRKASASIGRPIGIIFDLQGPKIRLGQFDGPPRAVRVGDVLNIAVGRAPGPDELPSDYPLLDQDVKVGHRLLISDGELSTEVIEVSPGLVRCRASNDAAVRPRQGINLPDSTVSAPPLTEKDKADVAFAVHQNVDAIALSFVRRASDVEALRVCIAQAGGNEVPIISKIEKPQALENLDEILKASWGVMVARGDLGVELSPEEVPMAQKQIIQLARRMHRPVITATQMLESMTRNPRPTRAEASDVANAVLDGTDAVMLSAETATGKYPGETVAMMARIIRTTEGFHARAADTHVRQREPLVVGTAEAVSVAACEVALHLRARALVAFTQSGRTALLAAGRRPITPILAFTSHLAVRNLLTLVWGVQPNLIDEVNETDRLIEVLDATLLSAGLAREGDRLVVLMGAPTRRMGPTNLMLVYNLGQYKRGEGE